MTDGDDGDDDDLLGAILKVEDDWKVERALEGLGRLLPRRARRCVPDQIMVDDYLRGDVDEVRRRANGGVMPPATRKRKSVDSGDRLEGLPAFAFSMVFDVVESSIAMKGNELTTNLPPAVAQSWMQFKMPT